MTRQFLFKATFCLLVVAGLASPSMAATLSVTVTAPGNVAVPNAFLVADKNGNVLANCLTDITGKCSLTVTDGTTGNLFVILDLVDPNLGLFATPSPVPFSIVSGTVPINVALQAGVKVSGVVTDTSNVAVANIFVGAVNSSTNTYIGGKKTDAKGQYTLVLPQGISGFLFVDTTGSNFAPPAFQTFTNLQQSLTINFQLALAVHIKGTITGADTNKGVAGVFVGAFDPNAKKFLGGNPTSADGSYSFVVASGSSGVVFVDVSSTSYARPADTPISNVTSDQTINIVLQPAIKISGTVTDASTNKGVANLFVAVIDNSNPPKFLNGQPTDTNGNYALTVPTGTSGQVVVNTFGSAYTFPTPQSISNLQSNTTINFQLSAGAKISGTVTDSATNKGVAKLFVAAIDNSNPPKFITGAPTDANGNYSFSVAKGTSGQVIVNTFGSSYTQPTPQTISNVQSDTTINFQLSGGVKVSGTVTDSATNKGVANVFVAAISNSNPPQFITGTPTDGNGNYSFTVAKGTNGQIIVNAFLTSYTQPTPQTISNLQSDTTVNFQLSGGIKISGTVTDSATNKGVANVFIAAIDNSNPPKFITGAQTDASGNYSFFVAKGVSGQIIVNTFETSYTQPTPQTISNVQADTAINFQLSGGVKVSGTVTDSATNKGVANVFVAAINSSNPPQFITGSPTDGNGNYSFTVAKGTNGQVIVNTFGSSYTQPTPQTISNLQSDTTLNFQLSGGVKVSGTVTDSANNPVPKLFVAAINNSNPPQFITGSPTTQNGTYTFTVAKGTSGQVIVNTFGSNFPQPAPQTISNLQSDTTINFQLSPGIKISGTVTDSSTNMGVANLFVAVVDNSNPPKFLTGQQTNVSGQYSITVAQGTSGQVVVNTFGTSYPQPTPQTISNLQSDTMINFQLTAGVKISGTVIDPASNPVPGIFAGVSDNSNPPKFVAGQLTNASGQYSFSVAKGTSGNVFANTGGTTFAPPAPQPLSNIQADAIFNFQLLAGVKISGKVTDSVTTNPVPNTFVGFIRSDNNKFVNGIGTDAQGTFSFTIPSGLSGSVFANPPQASGYLQPSNQNLVNVTTDQVVTFTLSK